MLDHVLQTSDPHSIMFTRGTRRAVIVTALAGLLSCILVSLLLMHILFVGLGPLCMRRTRGAVQDGERNFLRRQLGIFVVCLFLSDFIQSISGMIQIRWVAHGGVVDGTSCTTQAVTLLAGDLGTCIWNALVATHTFMTIVLRRSLPQALAVAFVVLAWAAVVLACIIGPLAVQTPGKGPFYGASQEWCFITDPYADARLYIHYVPILVSALTIFVLYSLVFFSLRGNIVTNAGSFKLRLRTLASSSSAVVPDIPNTQVATIARKMLWYPSSRGRGSGLPFVAPATIQ